MTPTSNNNNVIHESPEAKARKRRLAWACAGVALLDLILLLLLIFLPGNCAGNRRCMDGDDHGTVVKTDTIVKVEKDTVVIVQRDSTQVEPVDSAATDIDESVEEAGGNVGGFMRFSIKWNQSIDLDAHAKEPTGAEIYFDKYVKDKTVPEMTRAGGQLDVDMIHQPLPRVENIVWEDASRLPDGNYRFFIHNFSSSERSRGCEAQLKVGNKTFKYSVGQIGPKDIVTIATVAIRNHQMESINQSSYLVQ